MNRGAVAVAAIAAVLVASAGRAQEPPAQPFETTLAERELIARDQPQAAIEKLRSIPDQRSIEVAHLLGVAYYHADDYPRAIEELVPVVEKLPAGAMERREPVQVLGLCQFLTGHFAEAIRFSKKRDSGRLGPRSLGGTATSDRTHTFAVSTVAEIPVGRGRHYMGDISRAAYLFIGGWQFNQNTMIQSGFPFNVTYRKRRAGSGHRTESAESDRRSQRAEDEGAVVQRNRDRIRGERILPPGEGHIRRSREECSPRTGLLAHRCVAVQALRDQWDTHPGGADRGGEHLQQRQPEST